VGWLCALCRVDRGLEEGEGDEATPWLGVVEDLSREDNVLASRAEISKLVQSSGNSQLFNNSCRPPVCHSIYDLYRFLRPVFGSNLDLSMKASCGETPRVVEVDTERRSKLGASMPLCGLLYGSKEHGTLERFGCSYRHARNSGPNYASRHGTSVCCIQLMSQIYAVFDLFPVPCYSYNPDPVHIALVWSSNSHIKITLSVGIKPSTLVQLSLHTEI
jgi:hypothetical protein